MVKKQTKKILHDARLLGHPV